MMLAPVLVSVPVVLDVVARTCGTIAGDDAVGQREVAAIVEYSAAVIGRGVARQRGVGENGGAAVVEYSAAVIGRGVARQRGVGEDDGADVEYSPAVSAGANCPTAWSLAASAVPSLRMPPPPSRAWLSDSVLLRMFSVSDAVTLMPPPFAALPSRMSRPFNVTEIEPALLMLKTRLASSPLM